MIKTKTSEEDRARVGVVVSKKVEAKAVGRNRIKRQVRSYIEKILPTIKKGQDILIIARKDARDKTTKQIRDTIEESLKKAKVLI
ncbi:MAG: ribonuclease P protein component [Patescibacteria group bacterium]